MSRDHVIADGVANLAARCTEHQLRLGIPARVLADAHRLARPDDFPAAT